MDKQALIEKLAKKMCMAVNAKASREYMERTSLHLNALYDEERFTHQATIAVSMFWPLVEALQDINSDDPESAEKYMDGPLKMSTDLGDLYEKIADKALSTLEGK